MELSLLLTKQILSMFIMMFMGYAIVKLGAMKPKESKSLSTILLYVISPCAIINSFQIDCTKETFSGLMLAGGAAIIIHIVYLILTNIFAKIFGLDSIEKASIMYTNCGNLIIPLVTAVLGPEWVIYTSGYLVVQTFLLWTHAKCLVSEIKDYSLKKIISNVNIIAIIVGFIMFVFGIKFPSLIGDTVTAVASTIGPISMWIIGMLFATMNFKKIFLNKRVYVITTIRMVLMPLIVVFLLAYSGIGTLHPKATEIFVVTLLAASAPVASTITQFAQIFDKDSGYASVINVMTVVVCLFTMPMMVMLYQMLT